MEAGKLGQSFSQEILDKTVDDIKRDPNVVLNGTPVKDEDLFDEGSSTKSLNGVNGSRTNGRAASS